MANKKISELTLRSDVDATCNFPTDDTSQTWRVTAAQIKSFIAPFTTLGDWIYGGSGGDSTRLAGNTTTAIKYPVQVGNGTISAAPTLRELKAPTYTKLTSGATNYTTPANVLYLKVRVLGGGGGGGGSANASANAGNGGAGGNTTFGASTYLLQSNGGGGGGANSNYGGNGGVVSVGAAWTDVASRVGAKGLSTGGHAGVAIGANAGGMGGVSPLGGAGVGPAAGSGSDAVANTGSGAGGADSPGSGNAGAGGGAGGYIEAMIAPTAGQVFAYSIGAGGTSGAAGSSGSAGGVGGSGVIIVEEHYQ